MNVTIPTEVLTFLEKLSLNLKYRIKNYDKTLHVRETGEIHTWLRWQTWIKTSLGRLSRRQAQKI